MSKENSIIVRISDFITKYAIYTLVFLMPLFFLPITTEALDFNKQALLVLFIFVGLFAWMLKVFVSGKLSLNKSKINIAVGVLFLAYLLSVILSVGRYGSFWGWPSISSESLLTVICFGILYFLVSNTFTKKDIFISSIVFSVSVLIAELFGILQVFHLYLIPLKVAQAGSFNTVGLTGALGLLAAIIYPLTLLLLIYSKKWWKILFGAEIVVTALLVLLINYPVVWWIILLNSILVIIFGIIKKNLFDGRWMSLPMFFLAISLFFIILNPQIKWLPEKATEVSLSPSANFAIDISALKERPVFGSGTGTFAYDFSEFKNPDFNKSQLWNINFDRGNSKVLTNLATLGVVGLLAWIFLMVVSLIYGGKLIIFEKTEDGSNLTKETKSNYSILMLGMFLMLASETVVYFLYTSNIALDFAYFFMLACLVCFISEDKKNYDLTPSSKVTLITTFCFTLMLIFGVGILIVDGQRYFAEINYHNGIESWQGGNEDSALKNLETAADSNSGLDLYFRQLAQAYLLKAQDEASNTKEDQKTKSANIQKYVSNAVNAAKTATDLGPKNVDDWSSRGYIYQNLIGVISDTEEWAIKAYEEALKLDPNNPYLLTQKGMILFNKASKLASDQTTLKNKTLSDAQDLLLKAVSLNPNYSNGFYYSGLVYDAMGQRDAAINAFTKLASLNPDNNDIKKVLANLQAGKAALDGLNQQQPQPSTPTQNPEVNPKLPTKTPTVKTTTPAE